MFIMNLAGCETQLTQADLLASAALRRDMHYTCVIHALYMCYICVIYALYMCYMCIYV